MLGNALLLAVDAIRRNAMRSFLTILGIVIGVAAVIVMVTLGSGATAQVTEQISALGTNLLMVRPGQRMGPGPGGAAAFELADAEAIAREIGSVAAVAAGASAGATAIFGNENWSTTVWGVDNQFFAVRDWELAGGRKFAEGELRAGRLVCILGETVRKELFGGQQALGAKLRLEKLSCQVIGLLEPKGQAAMGPDQDDVVLIPLRAFQRRISGNREIRQIQVSAREGAATSAVKRDIERLLRARRRIAPNEDDDFQVMDTKELAQTLTGTTKTLTALLGAVAAVSLLVGGIGIMNIMLVSVVERTREIGVRLSIGALERDVLMQFLVEAVVLSSLGGLIGIVLALASSLLLTRVLAVPFVVDLGIIGLAFIFSAAVGVLFGYFPARRAARLDPIEALRHE
jgi:putative ABC transport system permease protein